MFEREKTVYYALQKCISKLQNPEKVEKYLKIMFNMEVTSGVLKAIPADKIISAFFDHPVCGQLAREIAFRWASIRTKKYVLKRKIVTETQIASKKTKIDEISCSETPPNSADNTKDDENLQVTAIRARINRHKRMVFCPPVDHNDLPYSTYRRPSDFKKIGNYENLDEIAAALKAKRKAERIARTLKTEFPPIDHTALPYSTYTRPENFENAELQKAAIPHGSQLIGCRRGQRIIGADGRPMIKITYRK